MSIFTKIKNASLYKYNVAAIIAHSFCLITLIVLYCVYKNARRVSNITLYRNQLSGPIAPDSPLPPPYPKTLKYCSTQGQSQINPGQCTVSPSFQQPLKVSMINNIVACMVFFFITILAHSFYASDYNGYYSSVIQDGWNPYRWFEYAMSAGLMSVILGSVQGTVDIVSLLFMGGTTSAMQFFGYVTESVMRKSIVDDLGFVQKEVIFGSHFGAWILFIFLWFGNLYSFFCLVADLNKKYKGVTDPNNNNKPIKMPSFVYFVVILQLFNYASFGFIQIYQVIKNWNVTSAYDLIDFVKIEKYYLLLSFFAKLGLAGGVSYGLILRVKNCT
jgi:hypothetical protein